MKLSPIEESGYWIKVKNWIGLDLSYTCGVDSSENRQMGRFLRKSPNGSIPQKLSCQNDHNGSIEKRKKKYDREFFPLRSSPSCLLIRIFHHFYAEIFRAF
jgi:hypothetical protein